MAHAADSPPESFSSLSVRSVSPTAHVSSSDVAPVGSARRWLLRWREELHSWRLPPCLTSPLEDGLDQVTDFQQIENDTSGELSPPRQDFTNA